MTKPAIKRVQGYWQCCDDKFGGSGLTPQEAYANWKAAYILWDRI
jgi:hypothetical protein